MRCLATFIVCLGVALGCARRTAPPAPRATVPVEVGKPAPPTPASATPTPCERSAAELGTWLRTLIDEGYAIDARPSWRGVPLESGDALDWLSLVVVDEQGAAFVDGAPPSTLLSLLKGRRELTRYIGDSDSEVAFAIDERATWGRVAPLVLAARTAGYTSVAWAFSRAKPALEPPPSGPLASSGARASAEAAEREGAPAALPIAMGGCPYEPLVTGLNQLEGQHALARSAVHGFARCDCEPDAGGIRLTFWHGLRRARGHAAAVVRTTWADGSAGTRIDHAAHAPWARVARSVLRAAAEQRGLQLFVGGTPVR